MAITPLPSAPLVTDDTATFNTKAFAWVDAIDTFTTEVNATATQISEDATTASNSVEASNAAIASANFKGNWNDLTGALNIPASVSHENRIWVLNENLADVTLSEPGYLNSDWTVVSFTSDFFEVSVSGTSSPSDWIQVTPGESYIATKTVLGIQSSDRPIVDVDFSSVSFVDIESNQEAWSKVYRIEASADNEIKLYATENITVDFDLILKVIR